jgi:glycerol-1-phosphate dehydrogenase [NAD(P)+]
VLVLDTRILRAAPYEMIVAGFGDVLGKYIAKADWLLSRIVNGEAVDENAVGLITQALENLVSHVDDIKNLTEKGLAAVIEGLILAGITIFTIGHTRAVASVEHNQGHIWETRMLESGRPYALHGISVGCSTGYYLRMYDYFRGLDIRALDRDAARSAILDYEKIRQDALSCFGEEFLAVIEAENPVFRVTRSEFERQYDALTTNWERILRTLSFLPGWDDYRRLYAKLAYPIDAEAIGIPPELLTYTLRYAHLYRDRYSVVDALHILGAAHMAADGTLADYRKLRDGDSCAGNGSDGLL